MINQLIQQAQPYWKQYVEHEFVQQLAKGTLPKACFQHYLKQDYIYLFHYSRAFALGVFKAKILPRWKCRVKRSTFFAKKSYYIWITAGNGKLVNRKYSKHPKVRHAFPIHVTYLIVE